MRLAGAMAMNLIAPNTFSLSFGSSQGPVFKRPPLPLRGRPAPTSRPHVSPSPTPNHTVRLHSLPRARSGCSPKFEYHFTNSATVLIPRAPSQLSQLPTHSRYFNASQCNCAVAGKTQSTKFALIHTSLILPPIHT